MEERKLAGFGFLTSSWPLDPKRPTLVFIHGAGGSAQMWRAQLGCYPDRANAVALDLPGHGQSDGPGRTDVFAYARAVADFIAALKPPKPVPAGLSMGGAIVQALLLEYPDQFPAAVLLSTGARLKVLPMIFQQIEKDYQGFVKVIGAFSASPKTDQALLKPYLEDAAKAEPKVVFDDFKACDAFDVIDRIEGITTPLLVITAEDDKLTPAKYGAFIAEKARRARRVHLQAAGHLAPLELPGEVSRAIIAFLDEQGL